MGCQQSNAPCCECLALLHLMMSYLAASYCGTLYDSFGGSKVPLAHV